MPGSYKVTAHLGLRYSGAILNTSRQISLKAYPPVRTRVRHESRWPAYIIAVRKVSEFIQFARVQARARGGYGVQGKCPNCPKSVRNARTVGAISFTAMAEAEKVSETVRKVSGVNVRVVPAQGGQELQGKCPKLSAARQRAGKHRSLLWRDSERTWRPRHGWIRRPVFTFFVYARCRPADNVNSRRQAELRCDAVVPSGPACAFRFSVQKERDDKHANQRRKVCEVTIVPHTLAKCEDRTGHENPAQNRMDADIHATAAPLSGLPYINIGTPRARETRSMHLDGQARRQEGRAMDATGATDACPPLLTASRRF